MFIFFISRSWILQSFLFTRCFRVRGSFVERISSKQFLIVENESCSLNRELELIMGDDKGVSCKGLMQQPSNVRGLENWEGGGCARVRRDRGLAH